MLVACDGCKRHIRDEETECPFCAAARGRSRRRAVKLALVGAAGLGAMTIGIGCAYGMPDDYGSDADVDAGVDDAADDTSGQ